jgi:hypothetical protein
MVVVEVEGEVFGINWVEGEVVDIDFGVEEDMNSEEQIVENEVHSYELH